MVGDEGARLMSLPQRRDWPRKPEETARIEATAANLAAKLDAYWRELEKRGGEMLPQDFTEALVRAVARVAMTGNGYRYDRFDHQGVSLADAMVVVWRDEVRKAADTTALSRGVR